MIPPGFAQVTPQIHFSATGRLITPGIFNINKSASYWAQSLQNKVDTASQPVNYRRIYPISILIYNPFSNTYRFTKPAAHLLSLVSGVSWETISSTIIQERRIGRYRPFYKASEGGGAITLGSPDEKTITYTENFFAAEGYDGHAYGRDIFTWLDLSAHEVGHLPQIDRKGGLFSYLGEFIEQYAKHGHDKAPYEIEAERGAITFEKFYKYINQTYGSRALENLLQNWSISEAIKVERIMLWWQNYQQTKGR